MTIDIAAIQAQLAEIQRTLASQAASGVMGDKVFDSPIAPAGSSHDQEETMIYYKWLGNPTRHHAKFRIYYCESSGDRGFKSFSSEAEALGWKDDQSRHVNPTGHPIGPEIEIYLESSKKLEESSKTTLRYRLKALVKDREAIPVESFPWEKAWKQHIAPMAAATQIGVLAAVNGFVASLKEKGTVKSAAPLKGLKVEGRKSRGKKQVRIDEATKLVQKASESNDPESLAVVVTLMFGLRVGETVRLTVRDVDARGTILWVDGTKNSGSKRRAEIPPSLRPALVALTKGRPGDDLLFVLEGRRARRCKDVHKARKDLVTRRLRALCKAVGLPILTPQSLRGMHATFSREAGQTAQSVATALGHNNVTTQRRHYLRPGVEVEVSAKVLQDLLATNAPVTDSSQVSNRGPSPAAANDTALTDSVAKSESSECEEGELNSYGHASASTSSSYHYSNPA